MIHEESSFGSDVVEGGTERNKRFIDGRLTDEEIKSYWVSPARPLFEHEIVRKRDGKEERFHFKVRGLTPELKDQLIQELKEVWTSLDLEAMSKTFDLFFEQRKLGHAAPLNVEYYVATDTEDKPLAVTGIYTIDIQGGAGFATRDKLKSGEHHLATGLGWFAVGKKYQGTGLGGYLLGWIENMARARGSDSMFIETDDYVNEETARRLYEKRGYKRGLRVEDYFGPGRDQNVYFKDISQEQGLDNFIPSERITEENKDELIAFAEEIYSPQRSEEFKVCLDLLLKQRPEEKTILRMGSFILRGADGKISSFAILRENFYTNAVANYWHGYEHDNEGTKLLFFKALSGYAKSLGRNILILFNEGVESNLSGVGFKDADQGIPGVFGRDDSIKFLLYTKELK